jgi:hypothetical protein
VITNKNDISLALAVWLLSDDYDYQAGNKTNYISVTSLMRPLRQLILMPRVQLSGQTSDVEDRVPSALGNAIHNAIEYAWLNKPQIPLTLLGYPQEVIRLLRVNPTDDELEANPAIIPVYLEQRAYREYLNYTIGGKFDMVTEGVLQDAKSTSVYTYIGGKNDEAYKLQMSMYRWIDSQQKRPKITEDYGTINFIFTDWSRSQSNYVKGYPKSRVAKKDIPLMTLAETDAWVKLRLTQLGLYFNKPENELPECTEEELWRADPLFKYYADPTKTKGRSTRNFTTKQEAAQHLADKGKGVVIPKLGEPKRCNYCPAFSICTQKDKYFDVT